MPNTCSIPATRRTCPGSRSRRLSAEGGPRPLRRARRARRRHRSHRPPQPAVVAGLLDAGIPAGEVVAVVRSPEKAADLADRGVQVRQASYDEPAALEAALKGIDRLLLVSGSEVGRRVRQHGNVLQAAGTADVSLLVYTSAPEADDTPLPLAPEHTATEQLIADSGIPAVVLRDNWCFENYDRQIDQAATTGELIGSAGEGRVAAATRADPAAATVAVLTAQQPTPGVVELAVTRRSPRVPWTPAAARCPA